MFCRMFYRRSTDCAIDFRGHGYRANSKNSVLIKTVSISQRVLFWWQ